MFPLELMLERIEKLEQSSRENSSSIDLLTSALPQVLSDVDVLLQQSSNHDEMTCRVQEVKDGLNDVEEKVKVMESAYDDEMQSVMDNIQIIATEVEELSLRFESFLRAFSASKSENMRMLSQFDRRMSDVETKGLLARINISSGHGGDKVASRENTENGSDSEVFRDDEIKDGGGAVAGVRKSSPAGDGGKSTPHSTDLKLKMKKEEERVMKEMIRIRNIEDSLLTRVKEEARKDVSVLEAMVKNLEERVSLFSPIY